MHGSYFSADTLDDLMRSVICEIQTSGIRIKSSKGPNTELMGVLLELTNPRARLSRTESKGKIFSCLGQTCWYLAKSNDLEFMLYYLARYKDFADGNTIFGGYGPRLFNWAGLNQVDHVIRLLKRRSSTRQAVIQIFDRNDIIAKRKEIPCTCTLQFFVREKKLSMFTAMRSNDVMWGLPHDFFFFTMLQEMIARELDVELGIYKHAVGSLHLYDRMAAEAESFLGEGWQSTKIPMPKMPRGSPTRSVRLLLSAEAAIRTGTAFDFGRLANADPYWADLVRLLQVFRAYKDAKARKKDHRNEINLLLNQMSSGVYCPFVEKLVAR